MWLTLATIFLLLVWIAALEIPAVVIVLFILLAIAVLGAIVWMIAAHVLDAKDRVVRAVLLEEIAVYKEKVENTGFSIGWGWRSGRSYYRYRNVLDHYECIFNVVYLGGETGTIRCRKGDAIYYELIRKGS